MGKAKKKTGKGRLDKYYKLAKEQGYRARSAFKLIQLNRKYAFLESARCCIDLCAAPGGWLQVASKYMPSGSLIVGVDLVSIKPIPRVSTFAADITTPHCRQLIRGELKDWKADVVLHDGAPNVGTAWVQDAYSQSELVLMSLKLAVEFLIKGGTFVTKVFRSVDYNSLIWVFNQLFGKVEATKPPSSRNVSAEIFVVCQNFLAPKSIDPKFLDPRHVFKELSAPSTGTGMVSHNAQSNVFQPSKKRRHRDGYEEGNYTLFNKSGAAEFVHSNDPIGFLGSVNQVTFVTAEEKGWMTFKKTTPEILQNCEDLKVLGKGDFKALLKWRSALREEIGLENKTREAEGEEEPVEVVEEVDEDQQIQDELERLNIEAAARLKRERRRANEVKTRTLQRMQLQMTAPLDIGMEQGDASLAGQDDVFNFGDINGRDDRHLTHPSSDDSTDDDETRATSGGRVGRDDEEPDDGSRFEVLEAEIDGMYDDYRQRLAERSAKFKVQQSREKNKEREEWGGITKRQDSDSEEGESSEEEGGWDLVAKAKANIGEDSSDYDSDVSTTCQRKRKRPIDSAITAPSKHSRLQRGPSEARTVKPRQMSRTVQVWFDRDLFADIDQEVEKESDHSSTVGGEDTVDEDLQPQDDSMEEDTMWDATDVGPDTTVLKQSPGLVTAEAVALAQQLVNRRKTQTDLINDGFHRYSLNSKEGLPSWFLDDETRHYKSNIPITKEAVAALRAKQRALDARPIKKIAEAKARKKFKALQRLEKATKKAEGINGTSDLTEREKAQQIEKLMRKGMAKGKSKERKEVKVVVAKGVHRGIQGRPKGVKGRYVMVDARMKKELRAHKRKEKTHGRSRR